MFQNASTDKSIEITICTLFLGEIYKLMQFMGEIPLLYTKWHECVEHPWIIEMMIIMGDLNGRTYRQGSGQRSLSGS